MKAPAGCGSIDPHAGQAQLRHGLAGRVPGEAQGQVCALVDDDRRRPPQMGACGPCPAAIVVTMRQAGRPATVTSRERRRTGVEHLQQIGAQAEERQQLVDGAVVGGACAECSHNEGLIREADRARVPVALYDPGHRLREAQQRGLAPGAGVIDVCARCACRAMPRSPRATRRWVDRRADPRSRSGRPMNKMRCPRRNTPSLVVAGQHPSLDGVGRAGGCERAPDDLRRGRLGPDEGCDAGAAGARSKMPRPGPNSMTANTAAARGGGHAAASAAASPAGARAERRRVPPGASRVGLLEPAPAGRR